MANNTMIHRENNIENENDEQNDLINDALQDFQDEGIFQMICKLIIMVKEMFLKKITKMIKTKIKIIYYNLNTI